MDALALLAHGFSVALTPANLMWCLLGCTLGIVPHIAAAIGGLATVLHTSALAFQTLKILGVAYLLWMAWGALRESGPLRAETTPGVREGAGSMAPWLCT